MNLHVCVCSQWCWPLSTCQLPGMGRGRESLAGNSEPGFPPFSQVCPAIWAIYFPLPLLIISSDPQGTLQTSKPLQHWQISGLWRDLQ